MTSIEQMVSAQPGIIRQVTGALTYTIFWSDTIFVDQYYNYCYTHLMRGNSAEETIRSKEGYKRLADTYRTRVCAFRANNRKFADHHFKEAVQTCRRQIIYCGVGYYHQNEIFERRIKELTLGS